MPSKEVLGSLPGLVSDRILLCEGGGFVDGFPGTIYQHGAGNMPDELTGEREKIVSFARERHKKRCIRFRVIKKIKDLKGKGNMDDEEEEELKVLEERLKRLNQDLGRPKKRGRKLKPLQVWLHGCVRSSEVNGRYRVRKKIKDLKGKGNMDDEEEEELKVLEERLKKLGPPQKRGRKPKVSPPHGSGLQQQYGGESREQGWSYGDESSIFPSQQFSVPGAGMQLDEEPLGVQLDGLLFSPNPITTLNKKNTGKSTSERYKKLELKGGGRSEEEEAEFQRLKLVRIRCNLMNYRYKTQKEIELLEKGEDRGHRAKKRLGLLGERLKELNDKLGPLQNRGRKSKVSPPHGSGLQQQYGGESREQGWSYGDESSIFPSQQFSVPGAGMQLDEEPLGVQLDGSLFSNSITTLNEKTTTEFSFFLPDQQYMLPVEQRQGVSMTGFFSDLFCPQVSPHGSGLQQQYGGESREQGWSYGDESSIFPSQQFSVPGAGMQLDEEPLGVQLDGSLFSPNPINPSNEFFCPLQDLIDYSPEKPLLPK